MKPADQTGRTMRSPSFFFVVNLDIAHLALPRPVDDVCSRPLARGNDEQEKSSIRGCRSRSCLTVSQKRTFLPIELPALMVKKRHVLSAFEYGFPLGVRLTQSALPVDPSRNCCIGSYPRLRKITRRR